MLREQMINFLEAAVVFLLATKRGQRPCRPLRHATGERGVGSASSQGRDHTPLRCHGPRASLR
jgi:hypothetical protein